VTVRVEEKQSDRRFVPDTNSLVSRLLLPQSLSGRAVSHAMRVGHPFERVSILSPCEFLEAEGLL